MQKGRGNSMTNSSPNIITEIKSNRMGWAEHAAGKRVSNPRNVLVGKLKGKSSFGISLRSSDGHINMDFKEIRHEWYGRDSTGLGQSSKADFYQHGNNPSGSFKGRAFLDHLINYKCCMKGPVSNSWLPVC
jgi:hypothetical protein